MVIRTSRTRLLPQTNIVDVFSTEHLQPDLKGRSVRGGLLTLTSQGTQLVLQSVSTVVLARLLVPTDFGLVAMVTAIMGVAQGFADLGLSEATIQREQISHGQVSTLFWINLGIGLTLMLVTVSLAPALVAFYREPRLRTITFLLSLTFFIGGLRVQHDALLKRQMRFPSLAIRDVTSSAFAVTAGIIMAWRGAGYWALAALPLILNSVQMALSWSMAKWIPGLPRRDAHVGSLVSFGGGVAGSYLIMSLNRSADNVLVGWYWGAGPLGLYSRAYNLLMLPFRQLVFPASSVAVSAFSRMHGDPERFAKYYLRAVNLVMWISTPVFGFLFVVAEPLIVLTLGGKWREAAPVFQILALSALGQVLLESTIWSLVSRGQTKRLLKLSLVMSPILIGSFAFGLPFGIKGVALSGSLIFVAFLPWILRFTFRETNLTLRRLGAAIVWPTMVGSASVLLAELAFHVLVPHSIFSKLLVAALSFAATYSVSMLIPPIRQEVFSLKRLVESFGPLKRSA
jgi:O-antigen/teichoic acid export membrane protein